MPSSGFAAEVRFCDGYPTLLIKISSQFRRWEHNVRRLERKMQLLRQVDDQISIWLCRPEQVVVQPTRTVDWSKGDLSDSTVVDRKYNKRGREPGELHSSLSLGTIFYTEPRLTVSFPTPPPQNPFVCQSHKYNRPSKLLQITIFKLYEQLMKRKVIYFLTH